MSLHAIASHMATKGRGPDTMLVHMAPSEVHGLQALAKAHGGSLTINPDTGLPEAGWLSKLLPTIIGIALAPATGGASLGITEAWQTAALVGGAEALRTGDLGKGLMAGMGAYGGAGIGNSLAGAGANVLTGEATGLAANEAGKLAGEEAVRAGLQQGLSEEAVNQLKMQAIDQAAGDTARVASTATPWEKLTAGAGQAVSSPSAAGQFAKDNFKYIGAAAAPILADQAVKANMPTTVTRPGEMHTFSYNPYGQLYTPTGNYTVPKQAAEGGLMSMADGGYSPGMLNFVQRSEPVVRMASGGIASYATGGVSDADILGWFNANPNADDSLIAQTMQQANVTPEQVARATGADYANVNQRYLAATAPATQTAQTQTQLANTTGAANTADTSGGLGALAATTGTTAPTYTGNFTNEQINDYIRNNNLDAAGILAAEKQFNVNPADVTGAQNAQAVVENVYRNVLGRDADPNGLAYWVNQIQSGKITGQEMYANFLKDAKANKEIIANPNLSLDEAVKEYGGYKSSDAFNIVDEWVRNTLGREVTDADRKTQWYKDATDKAVMNTYDKAKNIFSEFKDYATRDVAATTTQKIADAKAMLAKNGLTEMDVLRQTGKTIAELVGSGMNLDTDIYKASQLRKPGDKAVGFDFSTIKKAPVVPPIVTKDSVPSGFYGNTTNPGDITRNTDGTVTVHPNIPYRPVGGFSGMEEVRNAYTEGGGRLGYIPYAPKTMEEFEAKYNTLTGGSKQAYDYLTGKTKYTPTPYTETGEVMKPYAESVLGVPANISSKRMLFDPATKTYKLNPDYVPVSYTDKGKKVYGLSSRDIAAQLSDTATSDYEKWATENNVTLAQVAEALGISLAEAKKRYPKLGGTTTANTTATTATTSSDIQYAVGGLAALAGGGSAQYDLGGYSDGGRLLRGPGDGVSDSIPATIGNKRPARLADGEFVVPARIVSELGNGSTEAGARKLYAMMDRVQAARRGTVGKGRVAKNSRADKHLPA